jgi:hypothetical protein
MVMVEAQATGKKQHNLCLILASEWLLGILFNPEDRGSMFLRNVD